MNQVQPGLQRLVMHALYRRSFAAFVWRVFEELHAGQVPYVAGVAVAPRAQAARQDHRRKLRARSGAQTWRRLPVRHGERAVQGALSRDAPGATQDELKTTKGSRRKAVSTGGAVTGHGADYPIVDDLLKATDAASETELLRAQDYIEGSLLSCFDNPAEGRVVAIKQRLHELDPAGHLLGKGICRHLNLPAIAEEEEEEIALGRGRVQLRRPGDLLFPQRLGREVL